MTKEEAIALGLKRYTAKKPCKRGHISERYINGECVECKRIKGHEWRKEWTKKFPEKRREMRLKYYAKYPEKRKAYKRRTTAKRYKLFARIDGSKYLGKRTGLAIPKWIDRESVRDMYIEAKYFNLQIDHIVPLISDKVCGLHWEGNLQIISATENALKGNRIWPDMP